ncbi:hypothetical protein F0562_019684 [Nyssa sinensis]|uniref:NAD-dependent epimerase/dehydratase domain-containing protein n=1 Tax=Nyssa sinensis TaxID=561372 RepID=A0A5J5BUG8_9ASTE|nr:hypothetical protein F0562_019684 [Nyssa sinensis]
MLRIRAEEVEEKVFFNASQTSREVNGKYRWRQLWRIFSYESLEREPYWPSEKLRVSITGAGGFIAYHIARCMKSKGHYIIASEWKKNEHMIEDIFYCEFDLMDHG